MSLVIDTLSANVKQYCNGLFTHAGISLVQYLFKVANVLSGVLGICQTDTWVFGWISKLLS